MSALTVKTLKKILNGVNEDAIIIFRKKTDSIDELMTIDGYDYVHSTAKSNSTFEILGCGMSWDKESCNIVYLYDSNYE